MRDFRDAKAMARSLREALGAKTISITHGESLELVSRMLGVADWNTLSASIKHNNLEQVGVASVEKDRDRPDPRVKNLVLIPNLGGDGAVWARTIAALDGVAARIGNTLEDDTLVGMARRILAEAPGTFCLAGVSMGGMVALEIMRLAPERVRGLALVGASAHRAPPVSEAGAVRFHQKNAAALAGLEMRAFAQRSLAGMVHPNAPRDVRDDLVEMMVRVGAATYARQYFAMAEREDQQRILPTIRVPTHVIHGANDRLSSTRLSAKIHRAVAGSEFHIIPDCGHLPPIEAPREMARHLGALLERSA
jgi:pimeloyl-ACP methyl ester carboxylesterase